MSCYNNNGDYNGRRKINKVLENANSSVLIEDMKNESEDLKIIKKALEQSKSNESFLFSLVKKFKYEKENKNGETKRL